MASIDSRVVTMKFDNKAFQDGVASTLSALEKLKANLDGGFSAKGPGDISKGMNISGAASQVEGLSAKFVALGTIGVTALSNITNSAIALGKNLAGQVSGINAMRDGFSDYELKVGATQTIMAGTGASIGTVTKHLKELDIYADKTIYSLSDMTNNIGKFTNAGVKLPVAVNAMKGIANVAAISGASAEEAARAMYNLGQAIGNGTVKLMDWKSVELANMGTKEFKEQLIDAAVAAGTLTKASDGTIRSLKGTEVNFKTFSQTLSEGWLTSKALTDTLEAYADETTEIGKKAYKAAQDVKTFSMMMETLAAAAGTGWTDTFEIVLGNLPEATKLFTGLTNAIGGVIDRSSDARNAMLRDWKKLGGRTALINGIANVFKAIGAIIKPIGKAFRDIFPRTTGEQLANWTKAFESFTSKLILSKEAGENLRRTFRGVFAVFSIASQIIGGIIRYFVSFVELVLGLGGAADSAAGGILSLTGGLGDILVALDKWLKKGNIIGGFFDRLIAAREKVFGPVLQFLGEMLGKAAEFLSLGFDTAIQYISDNLYRMSGILGKLKAIASGVWDVLKTGAYLAAGAVYLAFVAVKDFFSSLNIDGNTVKNVLIQIRDFFVGIGSAIRDLLPSWDGFTKGADKAGSKMQAASLSGANLTDAFDRLRAAISWIGKAIGAVAGGVWNFFREGTAAIGRFLGGLDMLDVAAGANIVIMGSFFLQFRRILKGIGDIFGDDGLFGSRGAISEAFGSLTDTLSAMQQGVKAQVIRAIAISVALLVASLVALSLLDVPAMRQGLKGILAIMVMVTVAMGALMKMASKFDASAPAMVGMGVALMGFAAAVLVMAAAVKVFASMDKNEFEDGMIRVAAALTAVTVAGVVLGTAKGNIFAASAGIIVMANALLIMAASIKMFSKFDEDAFENGGKRIALVLVGLVAAAVLLGLAKGGILAASAGITLMAGALALLVPVIASMGVLPWGVIEKGLIALGIALAGILVAGAIAGFIAPGLAALAATLLAIGTAAMLVSVAFGIFAAAATAFVAMIVAISAALPMLIVQWGLAWKTLLGVLTALIPEFVKFVITLVKAMSATVIKNAHIFGNTLLALLKEGLRVLVNAAGLIFNAGMRILKTLLEGIKRNIGWIVSTVADIVVKFLDALSNKLPRIIKAGVELLIKLLEGIEKATRDGKNIARATEAGLNIGLNVAKGVAKGLYDFGKDKVKAAVDRLLGLIPGWARDMLGINSPARVMFPIGAYTAEGVAVGIDRDKTVKRSIDNMGKNAVRAMKEAMAAASGVTLDDMDIRPTITPVLDLSQVSSEATRLNGLLAANVRPDVSLRGAQKLSEQVQATQRSDSESLATREERNITFVQNNNSPKALSALDIYRNTRGQLALAREALT